MSVTLTTAYPPKDSLIPTSSWTLEIIAEENSADIVARILWGDNDRPTGAWSLPMSDLQRLVAFAQPKQEK